jgi:anti-anti-sigma regulatory factor
MDRVMRIETRIDDSAVTLLVAGMLTASAVADFERALDDARRLQRPIVLDLSCVSLIDRPTLKYLIDVMEHDVRLVVCPDYVEHWMYRESTRDTYER